MFNIRVNIMVNNNVDKSKSCLTKNAGLPRRWPAGKLLACNRYTVDDVGIFCVLARLATFTTRAPTGNSACWCRVFTRET